MAPVVLCWLLFGKVGTLLLPWLAIFQFLEARCVLWDTALFSPNPDVSRVLFVRPWTGAMRVSKRWFLLVWYHLMCEFFEVVLVWSHGLLVLLSDTSIHDGLWQRLHLWIIANLLLYLFNGKGSEQAGLHNSLNELFCLLLQACFWCVCQIFC